MHIGRDTVYFLINVTVGDKQIKPAIIVVIEKTSAKTQHIVSRQGNACRITYLIEKAFSVVVPKMVGG